MTASARDRDKHDSHDSKASVDEAWRRATTAGNEAFAAGEEMRAREWYEAARAVAESILAAELQADGGAPSFGPMLCTISMHNVAELVRQRDPGQARAMLQDAVERLITLAQGQDVPLVVRISAARHLRPALEEALADAATCKHDGRELASLVERARAAVMFVQEILSTEST